MYLACRSAERANAAIEKLLLELPEAKERLIYLPFDLTDIESAEKAAGIVIKEEKRLDIVGEFVSRFVFRGLVQMQHRGVPHTEYYTLYVSVQLRALELWHGLTRSRTVSKFSSYVHPRPSNTTCRLLHSRSDLI